MQSVPVTLSLMLAIGGPVFDYGAITDQNGYYTITTNLLPGDYLWRVKNAQTLANGGTSTLLGDMNSVEMGTLIEGDADNDNCVRAIDFNIMKLTYGIPPGQPGYDPRADFTGDTLISVQDFNLIKLSYGQCGADILVGSPTPGATYTPSNTPVSTNTPTLTSTNTPTDTPTLTQTQAPTNTRTNTPTPTDTPTGTFTSTNTPTNTSTSTPTDTPTYTATPTGTPTYTATSTPLVNLSLIGHVTIAGRPDPPSPLQSVTVTLELRPLGGGPLLSYTSTTDNYGYITVTTDLLPGLVPGSYNWRIKNAQTLALSGSANLTAGVNQVEMGVFKEGDADNNNCVGTVDFNIMKVTYGIPPGQPGYDPRADFTGDTLISVQDFNLLKVNYGQCGADPISPFRAPSP
jgi:hypothetical protein